jgi:hypothetical protein
MKKNVRLRRTMAMTSLLKRPPEKVSEVGWGREVTMRRMKKAPGEHARRTTLRTQREVLRDVMLSARGCGAWLTLHELASLTHYGEASISAQLRHLRKPQYGGFVVEKRLRVGGCPRDGGRLRLGVSAAKADSPDLGAGGDPGIWRTPIGATGGLLKRGSDGGGAMSAKPEVAPCR